ncbi:MAG: bifunctional DNA-formamidopyrimidine glycosylase/DNA-(apurinic or apyrimidinic site) lyase [Candidatus Nanopelagicales bacterium]|nr:bifunctional DNA-formamidopyrimidine glycosylase/DNA-(apurinic or apyrimidinic site) lyase [Candidatus Nanopelagicales bacterium]
MPELPEVEVVRRGLAEHVTGRRINQVEVLHPRAVRRNTGSLPEDLVGERIRCVSRRGKYLWLPLVGDQVALVAHLGMSGQLLMQPASAPDEKHLRVRIGFADAGPQLRFVDQRTFGGVMTAELVSDGAGGHVPDIISHISRDPLDPSFDEVAWVNCLRGKNTEIKRALLDQSLISGIGNIYADEALWRAKLHGRRLTGGLTPAKIHELLEHAKSVMKQALGQGGTSFDALYVNVNGESGYFDRSLNAYGQEGEPCGHCGRPIRREKFMNRSSFFCPRCQRRG